MQGTGWVVRTGGKVVACHHWRGLFSAFLGKGLLETPAASQSGEWYLGAGYSLPPQPWVVSPCWGQPPLPAVGLKAH